MGVSSTIISIPSFFFLFFFCVYLKTLQYNVGKGRGKTRKHQMTAKALVSIYLILPCARPWAKDVYICFLI